MRALLAGALSALIGCPTALAHGGGAPGYTSSVTSLTPAVPGVTLTVLDGDDRVRLENESGQEVVVEGYDDEPYLRFLDDGVPRNLNSPATYLNDDRYGSVELPARADPAAAPEWELVTARSRYDWHDHRIHWMSTIGPPPVRAAPEKPHHVFDWTIPGTVDGGPLTIAGSLDYTPADADRPAWIYLVLPLAALALAAGAWLIVRRRSDA